MKLKLIALALAAGLALPAAAQANTNPNRTTPAELRHDQRVVEQQQHQLARAVRHGNTHRAQAERRELKFARQERREDRVAFAKQQHRRWHRHHAV